MYYSPYKEGKSRNTYIKKKNNGITKLNLERMFPLQK